MRIKILNNKYLTKTNKNHIKFMIERGLMSSKINRISYNFQAIKTGYTVFISKNEYSEFKDKLTQRVNKVDIQTIFWDEEDINE